MKDASLTTEEQSLGVEVEFDKRKPPSGIGCQASI